MAAVITDRRLESARRSLQAGFEHLENGRFQDAGALFRCAGKYLSEVGDREADGLGNVLTFPAARAQGASLGFAREVC